MLNFPQFHIDLAEREPAESVVVSVDEIQLGVSSKTGVPMLGLHLRRTGTRDQFVGWVYVQPKDLQCLIEHKVSTLPVKLADEHATLIYAD